MPEPRDPLLKVLTYLLFYSDCRSKTSLVGPLAGAVQREGRMPGGLAKESPGRPAEATEVRKHGVGVRDLHEGGPCTR
jgi:hypothetical protein